MPGDGHTRRGRALRSGHRRQVREARRRVGLHRTGAVARQLPEHPGHHQRGGSHRRRGDSPRLRIPVGERGLRRARREERLLLHRPAPGVDPADGRQGVGQAGDGSGRRAHGARVERRPARGRAGDRQDRAFGRLPGHHQGGGRRRRPRHAGRSHRSRVDQRGDDDQAGSPVGVRKSERLHGEVPGEPAAHRDPGPRRPAPQRRVARRPGLLDAAPAPEDHRGSAGARA